MKTEDDFKPQYDEITGAISKLMMDIDMTPSIRYKLAIAIGGSLVVMASQYSLTMGLQILDIVGREFMKTVKRRNSMMGEN